MTYEDHFRDIAAKAHRDLPQEELEKRVYELFEYSGGNLGHIHKATQIIEEYRNELSRREAKKNFVWVVVGAVAAVIAAVSATLALL